ncbi:hypothetical protein F4809DRAFT_135240 [Biscogniauxia mediterranea]|nr:hypothetical protein F4809DRAFT_135240 [Biscogniauxia mediterranea]
MSRVFWHRALQTPGLFRATIPFRSTPVFRTQTAHYSGSSQSVFAVSFWKSLIPKPLRPQPGSFTRKRKWSKEWNPATFYIFIFMFIGSMSINLIHLKTEFATFARRAEVRIDVLREVVEKLQDGEEVDVEKVLGTRDPEREKAWEEIIKEIEREDAAKLAREANEMAAPAKTGSQPEDTTKLEPETKKVPYSNFY